MNRRGFLGSILAACAAPAIVRADSLMRIVPRDTGLLLTGGARGLILQEYGDCIRFSGTDLLDPLLPPWAQSAIDARLDAMAVEIGRNIGQRNYVWLPAGKPDQSDPLGQFAAVIGKGYA